jgi:hypothetical protein
MAFAPAERISGEAAGQAVTEVAINPCSMSNSTFKHGETLVYKLYYNWNFVWLSAGEVTFRVKETKDQYHLSAHGATYKSYEWFYKVRDRYDTYVDKNTLLPVLSVRDIHEGKYRLYDKVTFDQQGKKAYSLRGKTKEVAKLTEYPIESCMHDILSIVYYTRNLDFDKMPTGSNFPIKIFMDKETWPLKVSYLGKEKDKRIKGFGKMNTIKFSPEVISGFVFSEGAKMIVWASDDQNKIPLMIESPVSVGSVKAVIKEYNGLRYPFNPAPEDD